MDLCYVLLKVGGELNVNVIQGKKRLWKYSRLKEAKEP